MSREGPEAKDPKPYRYGQRFVVNFLMQGIWAWLTLALLGLLAYLVVLAR